MTISARVQEEMSNGVAAVTLFWRNHSTTSPGPFTSAPMFDDGGHNDGVANDRLYAASVAPQADRTVIEFYLQAADTSGLTRTWPAPAWQTNNTYAQTPNALYQVDDQSSSTNMPFLRLVLTETERAEFAAINQNSDAEMNATFISLDGDGAKVRYGCGLRIRGAGSRNGTPKNWRLNIPTDNRWNGLSEINLNTRFIHSQLAGSVLSQKAGLPVADARIVQVRLNGNNLAPSGTPQNGGGTGGGFGAYILVEPINGDFAANHFPNDSQGNVYRASSGTHDADLASGGTNVDFYYVRGYSKTSNQSDNDWTDLASLTAVLSTGLPDASYVQAVRTNLNLQFAMRYFAVCTFFGFGETALCNGIGDDYAMYRGLNDPRFILLAHDFDTILGQGDSPTYWPVVNAHIWMMLNPPNPNGDPATLQTTLLRFMRHPEHAPVYFAELKRLADGPFSPAQADPVLDQILSGWGPDQTLTINPMKNYLASRRVALMTQVPLALTVSNTLATQSGFPFTATPAVTLFGTANAIDTRSVRVNGGLAGWSAWEARWTNSVTLQPGINRVLMQSFNSNDVEFARATVDIWYDDGNVASVSGAVAADTVWSAANGPYQVTASLTVSAGVTLTIQPGTTVYLSPGVGLTVPPCNTSRSTAPRSSCRTACSRPPPPASSRPTARAASKPVDAASTAAISWAKSSATTTPSISPVAIAPAPSCKSSTTCSWAATTTCSILTAPTPGSKATSSSTAIAMARPTLPAPSAEARTTPTLRKSRRSETSFTMWTRPPTPSRATSTRWLTTPSFTSRRLAVRTPTPPSSSWPMMARCKAPECIWKATSSSTRRT